MTLPNTQQTQATIDTEQTCYQTLHTAHTLYYNKPFMGHGKLRWIGTFFGFIGFIGCLGFILLLLCSYSALSLSYSALTLLFL